MTRKESSPIALDLVRGRIPWRIVCQRCADWEPEMLTVLEAAAINRVLTGDPKQTGLKNRCSRYAVGRFQERCDGLLRVEA